MIPSRSDFAGHAPPAVELALPAGDLQVQWRRCNMLANYLADYVAYEFAEREWAENLISTVANEFLEAVARVANADSQVLLRCGQRDRDLWLELDHGVRPELFEHYHAFLHTLGETPIDQLYFDLLTAADEPAVAYNQFGLVMLVHDFAAIITSAPDVAAGRISVTIRVPIKQQPD